ncbi:MAG: hypothetical protein AAFU41_10185 [Pseudomonadota bacterium]
MIRLIMFAACIAILVFAAATLARALQSVLSPAAPNPTSAQPGAAPMPARFRQITFVLLFLLLIGLASGWLGSI